jgi:hypothetical protein
LFRHQELAPTTTIVSSPFKVPLYLDEFAASEIVLYADRGIPQVGLANKPDLRPLRRKWIARRWGIDALCSWKRLP